MSDDLSQRVRSILERIPYIIIASIGSDGFPWNSPVFAAHDEQFNFYFGTHKDSQKAVNITANPHVFVVVFDSTAPAGTGEAVYMQAAATTVTRSDEIRFAHALLWERHEVPYWKVEEFYEPTFGDVSGYT